MSSRSSLDRGWPSKNTTMFLKNQRAHEPAGPGPPTCHLHVSPERPRMVPRRARSGPCSARAPLHRPAGAVRASLLPGCASRCASGKQALEACLYVLISAPCRPRCQASFTQLPSSRDTMLSSESTRWAPTETLSWRGFRAKSSFDTVRNSLPG